jgi:hypothetical protein
MMMLLREGKRNAGMDRYRQLGPPLLKLTHVSGNDVRKTTNNMQLLVL